MTICPFCGRDPFHYVDNGVGMEAVAVDCCELGDQFFRGMRPAPENVTLSWGEFQEIGGKLAQQRDREARADAGFQQDSVLTYLVLDEAGDMFVNAGTPERASQIVAALNAYVAPYADEPSA